MTTSNLTLSLRTPSQAIVELESDALSTFCILTGKNGAGKTQILQAIANGAIAINGSPQQSTYIDLMTFRAVEKAPDEIGPHNGITEDIRLIESSNLFAASKECYLNLYATGALDERDQPFRPNDGSSSSGAYLAALVECAESTVTAKNDIQLQRFAKRYVGAVRRSGKLAHLMTKSDFRHNLRPERSTAGFHTPPIDSLYSEYFRRLFEETHRAFLESTPEAPVDRRTAELEYLRLHPPPWLMVDEIFRLVREIAGDPNFFDFELTNPQQMGIQLDLNSFRTFEFKSELVRRSPVRRTVSKSVISSGERTILALIQLLFSARDFSNSPNVLLFDEIDASLHPTTIRVLISVLRQVANQLDISVILATHSPTTVALAHDGEVFEVTDVAGKKSVKLRDKDDVLERLTEGYFTLYRASKLIEFARQPGIVLLTEGNNIGHIEKVFDLFGVGGVHIEKNIIAKSGKDDLRAYFRFFSLIPGHHPTLFVWDCDAQIPDDVPSTNTYAFKFEHHQACGLAARGIENLYDDNHLLPFSKCARGIEGRRILDPTRKNEFLGYIKGLQDKHSFRNFVPLISRIQDLVRLHGL